MQQKIQQLHELRALTEKRRNLWNESVKNKIIDQVEAINKQFELGLMPEIRQNPNYDTLIFKTRTRPLGIIYNGSVVTQTGGGICFSQLTNGKIEAFIIPAKIEALEIGLPLDFIQLGCFEPEDISNKLIYDLVESLITHLIDFDGHEETMSIKSIL